MSKNGFSYYMAETDRFQDIKIKRLKKKYSCEGYAVYQYALNEIYRVEGCYIRFTEDQMFDCADYWDIPEPRIREIIDYCAEIGLFYAESWQNRGILTARSIQTRYLDMCKRAKKKTYIPLDLCFLEPEAVQVQPEVLPLFPEQEAGPTQQVQQPAQHGTTPEVSGSFAKVLEDSGNLPELSGNIPEKTDKEKKRKENSPSIPQGNFGVPPQEVEAALERLRLTVEAVGCCRQDWEYVRTIHAIATPESPIWVLLDDLRAAKGKYSFENVKATLSGLVQAGRLHTVPIPVDNLEEAARLLARAGVPQSQVKQILETLPGNEQTLREAVETVLKSKGKITMPGRYILKQFAS